MTAFYANRLLSPYERISPKIINQPLNKALAWLLIERGYDWSYHDSLFVIGKR